VFTLFYQIRSYWHGSFVADSMNSIFSHVRIQFFGIMVWTKFKGRGWCGFVSSFWTCLGCIWGLNFWGSLCLAMNWRNTLVYLRLDLERLGYVNLNLCLSMRILEIWSTFDMFRIFSWNSHVEYSFTQNSKRIHISRFGWNESLKWFSRPSSEWL